MGCLKKFLRVMGGKGFSSVFSCSGWSVVLVLVTMGVVGAVSLFIIVGFDLLKIAVFFVRMKLKTARVRVGSAAKKMIISSTALVGSSGAGFWLFSLVFSISIAILFFSKNKGFWQGVRLSFNTHCRATKKRFPN